MKARLLVVGVIAAGCSASASDSASTDTRPPTPSEWDRPVTRRADDQARTERAACTFGRGAMPAETLGASAPVERDIPIDTIVVLMQENRSFDHYFAELPAYARRSDIEVPPPGTSNPDVFGRPVPLRHAPRMCNLDTNHEWSGTHFQINGGKMDGFWRTNDRWSELRPNMPADFQSGERALWTYSEKELPFYYWLATTFGMADHAHASVPGPTWPNRMYLYSGTSFGRAENDFPDISGYTFPDNDVSVFDELEKRHVDWAVYRDGTLGITLSHGIGGVLTRWGREPPIFGMKQFYSDAAEGKLPSVVFIDPRLSSGDALQDDEHPPANVQMGQHFVWKVTDAMARSPQWKRSALIVTYDEHGGYYDHVVPPKACPPDDKPPTDSEGHSDPSERFDQLGIRVPLLVISPWVKRSHVSHVVYDHTSITRFIQTRFKLPALSGRDANAEPLLDFFDFSHPSFEAPPAMPEPPIDAAEQTYCAETFF